MNDASNAAEGGVTVTATPGGATTATAADGTYALTALPVGFYELTFTKANFAEEVKDVSVTAGQVANGDVTIEPADSPVVVAASVAGDVEPGQTVVASVVATPLDGSTVTAVQWSQTNSVDVEISTPTAATTDVILPEVAAYKAELIHVMAEPEIGPGQLPPNVPVPGEAQPGIQDRFYIPGIVPYSLELAGHVALQVQVTTTSGTYTETLDLHAALPWKEQPGIANVPLRRPVLLHGKTQAGDYDWALATKPSGSSATLADATTQNPEFTPDLAGLYEVTVTDTTEDPAVVVTLEIYAGRWQGGLTNLDDDGRPVMGQCLSASCHGTGSGDREFPEFAEWSQTGHAEIFTNNLNQGAAGHYGENCFVCHTVGWDPDVNNGGVDDGANYPAFLDTFFPDGHPAGGAGNFAQMLLEFPELAQLSNIQCENCHGPNDFAGGHGNGMDSRLSISSDVCGVCHGEPLRHARFQQWQLSPHANYELAIEESGSGNCSRCHTGNGFIAWEDAGFDAGSNVTVTWSADEAHSQTCVTCHDPHAIGTTTGAGTNATVRVEDDTPVLAAGYRVLNAGRGAICMVCHNTRRDLRNDDEGAGDVATTGRAPHGGAQADVLMGQNAFFVTTGIRGKHSLIADTCANCHMVQTPPPEMLAYNLGGTNHTFYASPDICSECHASITAEEIQTATRNQMDALRMALEDKIAEMIEAYADLGFTVTLTGRTDPDDEDVDLADVIVPAGATVLVENFSDSHGRQAADVSVNGGEVGHMQLRRISVDDGVVRSGGAVVLNIFECGGTAQDAAFSVPGADENGPGNLLGKVGWNYLMAHNERSDGVHNNAFSLAILNGAESAVNGIIPVDGATCGNPGD